MKIPKTILFLAISAFLIYQSYDLINSLLRAGPEVLDFKESLIIAFLINLYITGVFAFAGFVLPTNKMISLSYYKLKNQALLTKVYKILGVEVYRRFLLIVFWGGKKNRMKYFNGTRGGIQKFIYETKQSEFGHSAAFLFISLFSIMALFLGYFILVAISVFINIIANLYPAILQRYHRIRIGRLF